MAEQIGLINECRQSGMTDADLCREKDIAASTLSISQYTDNGKTITYKLKVKNYNDLCSPSTTPIVLGLLVLPEDQDEWIKWSTEDLLLKGCMYWASFSGKAESGNTGTVSVSIDKVNVLNNSTICNILDKIAREEWE